MGNRLLNILARAKWQFFISIGLAISVLLYRVGWQDVLHQSHDLKLTAVFLASIGSILALGASVSFGFLVFFLNQTNSRKHDLFYKFKGALFDFDSFLKGLPSNSPVVQESLSLSWKLKFVKFDEFPMRDWEDRLSSLVPHLKSNDDNQDDPNLSNKILGYLGYLEEIVSEIGLMCIRQIIAGVYVNIVIKAFSLIALVLLTLIITYLDLGPHVNLVIGVTPVFFGVLACLLFVEIGWYLYRETDELLVFVDRGK